MKYSAIITYTTGAETSATVKAASRPEAWSKLLKAFDDGDSIRSIILVEVLKEIR